MSPLSSPTLTFVTPPPGLAPLTVFTLNTIDGADGLYSLQADETSKTRLFVLDAGVHLPDYKPVLSNDQSAAIEITTPVDALVLVVVNPGETTTTVNLMAPIVVNAGTGACAQFILDDQDWPLHAELGTGGR
ncbi:MAG: flagellar assembly protein FliW [Cryobacterium sp.]|uniref:flagellar assembly protein FliW n=1 Tax=unclassified Cryobacterium TaxID=2649013 RepID=UPI0018CA50DE|nr:MULTISPECIES: flagellar assembly protein FliW [unclassified Cryobacterium]MCY7403329.1 flagellar assembly protein FliW [Cryobacterium sp.]MEC5154418.1 flagellar assembly factor FliW [Cryobacterium sp. CAN_C3]